MTPPRRPHLPRRVDPVVCLKSEIFGQGMECEWLKHPPLSTREERFAASGIQPEHIHDNDESPLGSPAPSPRPPTEPPRPRVITRAELEERCRHRTCPLEGGRRSDLASLAPAVQAASERMLEQFYEEPNPWKGGHARWVTEDQVAGDRPSLDAPLDYNWADQRLYLDRHHVARLCRILQDPAQDMPARPSQDHVCVEFVRCLEQKWVTVDQLMPPNWLHVDQKLDHDEEKDRWVLDGSYMTHVPSSASKQDVVKPRERGRSRDDLNPIQRLQDTLQALFKYPSGEVTGTLMWDLKERVLCVQPSTATQYLELMRCTLDHALVYNSEDLLDELQLPHWYESTGVWTYQLLRYLCPVDMESLSDGILRRYNRHGSKGPPLELVSLGSNTKYYPVGDGLGGPGRVFSENAAAQEYVRLGEMRKMLKSVNTRQQGYDALDADAVRRPPPPNDMVNTRLTKRAPTQPPAPAAGAGPSQSAAGPSQAAAGPSQAAAGPSRARSISRSPPRLSHIAHRPTPSPASSDVGPVDNSRELSPRFVCATAAWPSDPADSPSRGRSPPASPAMTNVGSWAESIRVPRDARSLSPGGPPPTPPSPPRAHHLSQSPARAPPSPSGSDWDAVRMATSSDSSVGRFLSVEEVRALKDRRNLTVFMVRFGVTFVDRFRGQRVVYELGVCNRERGLRLRKYPGITSKVAKKHDKTIACGDRGWRLPLGGQTTSSNLLEAIMSAYADLSHHSSGHRRAGGHARNIEFSLCTYVELGSAHVLRCMAHPNATPVYYIFMEDQLCRTWRAEFTNEYFMRDDRKFTCLQWGTREVAAPWLLPALGALEARRLPPPPPAHQARVAERPEHMDTAWRRNVYEAVHLRPGVLRACISFAGSAVVWWWLGRGPVPMVAVWAMWEAMAWHLTWCSGTGMQAANAEVQTQEDESSGVLEDRLGMKEQQLNEKLSAEMRLLPADVGPRRVVKGDKFQPWHAILSREMLLEEKDMFCGMPDQIDWGRQDKLSEAVQIFMPGHWNEGHRTVLSKKYREQKARARQLRDAPLVPALAEEEVERRGELRHMTKAQVREASALQWGLELVITVPSEVRRLATEVDWKSVDGVWDPWAGTGVISEVMVEQWPQLRFMNNDWNSQLGWSEAHDALQPGN
ncbi:hypothetical protein CYMTET_47577 [Cymbomonas tetramitiformis]|uniref:Uncharacterized protein n=1 Tax=Cymbomonas tetramitiformis TaxID=36881 RepID=A0AAE0BTU1_9CHLO|nr:hypothetical protein CYMTET_47577 [Cymbomonas tetramitiformis]